MPEEWRLSERPVDTILTVLNRVADRFADPDDLLRREAALRIQEATGLAAPMVSEGLADQVGRIRGIGGLLDAELGSRYALDRFVERAPGLWGRAWGPGLLTCVFSGNVPGIPAFDMALALALKSSCYARPPKAEPHFAGLFAQAVAEADPALGKALTVRRWAQDDPAPYQRAGGVIAYGSDQTMTAIRNLVPPGVPFLAHGARLSFAVILRESVTRETARLLAKDVAWYDQQGCVSPHVAYVERGGPLDPDAFARTVGEELERLAQAWPRAPLTLAEAAALRRERDAAEWEADALFAPAAGLDWAVIHSESNGFQPSPLGRFLRTYAVDDWSQVDGLASGLLQTVAVAGAQERRLQAAGHFGALGASRIAQVGAVQRLHPAWHHDGRPTVAALVRWLDVES
jgi:acyl-CoA reductase-like NAD-dependent aldehyde dehydrogenase